MALASLLTTEDAGNTDDIDTKKAQNPMPSVLSVLKPSYYSERLIWPPAWRHRASVRIRWQCASDCISTDPESCAENLEVFSLVVNRHCLPVDQPIA
jgi:hypothetical protein